MAVERSHLTLEQFLALPEEQPALEPEDGEVTSKASPRGKHSVLQLRIAERIHSSASRSRRAMAFPELRVNFAGRSYVPDVAVFRWERVPLDDDGEVADVLQSPPDVVVELVSPAQSVTRLLRNCTWYVAHGVHAALIVDPRDRSVLVFRLGMPLQALHGDQHIDLVDVLPELDLTVAELFALLRIRER